MGQLAEKVMHTLYQSDIWAGYAPARDKADVQGWNGTNAQLTFFARRARPRIAIDVGVWKGMSTITMARAMKDNGIGGCVISVDTFLGSPFAWLKKPDTPAWAYERIQGRPDIFDTFLANVWHSDLADTVIPMPQTSVAAATILRARKIRAGLVHIDASHEYIDVKADLEAFWPVVAAGGVLLGDDYAWPGVKQAAHEFADGLGLPLQARGPKFVIRKPRGPAQAATAALPAPEPEPEAKPAVSTPPAPRPRKTSPKAA